MMVPKSQRSRAWQTGTSYTRFSRPLSSTKGFQCGYCISGQIMSAIGCIAEGHAHSAEEIKFWMSGNICRCGAYLGIVAAIADLAARR
jgi:aerobic-type carbon monoxide dehydrogenase small subunit (CoxS/CutS family)